MSLTASFVRGRPFVRHSAKRLGLGGTVLAASLLLAAPNGDSITIYAPSGATAR